MAIIKCTKCGKDYYPYYSDSFGYYCKLYNLCCILNHSQVSRHKY